MRALAVLATLVCLCCSDRREATSVALNAETAAPRDDLLPGFDALLKARPSLALMADTEVLIRQGGVEIKIGDSKRLSRTMRGDFDLSVQRVHSGSEAGDSEESFRAVRVGKDLFVRGSGGPFVRWDDPGSEPGRLATEVWDETTRLMRLVLMCTDSRREGSRTVLTTKPGTYQVPHETTRPEAMLSVHDCSGEVVWDGERPVSLTLALKMRVQALDRSTEVSVDRSTVDRRTADPARRTEVSVTHSAEVSVTHKAQLSDLPAEAKVDPPREVVTSHRERPLKMIQTVLGGLLQE